jgi:hypothetical protein
MAGITITTRWGGGRPRNGQQQLRAVEVLQQHISQLQQGSVCENDNLMVDRVATGVHLE